MKKTRIHVLIAEDDVAHANAIRRAFEADGSKTLINVVGTLREFRQCSRELPPDIAVMDLNLPDGHAVEALTYPPEAGPFPILLMTSYGNEQVAVTAIKSGALDYVVKSPEAFADMPHTVAHALHEWNLLKERKQAEGALREKEEWFRTVFENASDGLFFLSPSGEIVSVNESFAAMHGYSIAEILKLNLKALDPQEATRFGPERMRRILAGESLTFEVDHYHKQGHLFPLEVTANLVTMGSKKYILASHRDITERKHAENELRKINRALRLTSLCNQEMVRATDESALLRAICKIAVEHGGYRMAWVGFAEQDEAKSVRPAAHAGFEEGYLNTVNVTWADTERGRGPTGTAIRTGQTARTGNLSTEPDLEPWRAAAIQRGYASSIALPLLGEGRCFGALTMYAGEPDAFNPKEIELLAELANDLAYGIGALRHRVQRKRAEEALRVEERRYQTLAEISPAGIFRADAHGQTTYVNPRLCQITGLSAKDALGAGWLRAVHPQDREQVVQGWREAVQDLRNSTADYRFVHPDGTVVWVMGQAVPEKDDTGRVVGYVGTITDVTEKKQLESRLLRSQRLESVGRLASGIAHDLNNILAPMLMSAPVLREAIQDPDLRQLVDTIESSAVRGAGVIRQLLTFGRGLEGERVPVQLKSLVQDMCSIIRETFPKNIIAARETPAGAWLVRGDATQLHQILMNLCVNARDAMPDGGTLTLELENVEVNEAVASLNPGASPGRYVALSVTDTGTGISPENLDKIFDPFFTTKEVGKGTGLGLSTVIGIVKSHAGFIQVNSRMEQGTQFKIYLPACETSKDGEKKLKPGPLPQGRGELVLLVDDEESIRQVARQALERHGYRMIEASDGTQGLSQYTQHQSEVRLVITDLAMPFMDGPALIRALRRLNPQARIIAMSGHQSKIHVGHLPPKSVQALLTKPFTAAELLQTLKQVLHP
jgi:PAS domain S-box-containing protein